MGFARFLAAAFLLRTIAEAAAARFARSARCSAVMLDAAIAPPSLPPFEPCCLKYSRTSGGIFLVAIRHQLNPVVLRIQLRIIDSLRGLSYDRYMKVIGYARVSTDKQADKGVSLEAQTVKIQAMASLQDAELLDVIVDAGESAKSLKRPGIERLLELVNARAIDAVIVAKLDRLTRSVKDLADLLEVFNKRGVSLVSVAESLDTGSAAGRLVLNIMVSVSQWEREAIGERTRTAMQHKRTKGERVGEIPFGFRLGVDGTHLEAEPLEQSIIARIKALALDGISTRRIAERLEAEGIRTRKGTSWRFQYVASVLKAEAA